MIGLVERLLLWWHGRSTRRKMDRVFSRGEDPYGYRSSPYEQARLAAMEAGLGGPCARALEVGCAEGAFTERLVPLAGAVIAVDISQVPLARARKRLAGRDGVVFEQADIRRWSPPAESHFDAIVLGDVLYYLDKPLVQEEFAAVFRRIESWLAPGGRLLLAHGFAGPAEKQHREGFRRRFEELGLALVSEAVIGEGQAEGKVCCLLSVLRKPGQAAGPK